MNPPWLEDSESDDDDWMSQNIAKYEHLFMYKLEHEPLKIKVHPEGKFILLLSRSKKLKFELTIFKLPEKLLALNPEEEGLLNSRELTLKCGFYHEQTVLNCEFWPHAENSIVVLLLGKLELYQVKEDESDLLVKNQSVSINPCKVAKVSDKTVILISDYSVQLVDEDFKVSKTIKETGVLDCLVIQDRVLILKWNELKVFDGQDLGQLKHTISFGFNLSSPVALSVMESSIHLAAILNDTLLHTEFNYDSKKLHFEEIPQCPDMIRWTNDGSLVLVHEKKVQVYNQRNHVIFEHESSKKSQKIVDFSPHPQAKKVLLCIDNAKSLQAFSMNQNLQNEGNQV